MKIIGIDPGLATIGIGLLDAVSIQEFNEIDWCIIHTESCESAPERLKIIQQDLTEILVEEKPELAVVEKLFFAVNERTALDVAQARGVILATLAQHNILILEPTPLQLKSAITGDGRADKRQIQDMLVRLLKLSEIPQPDDAADALGLAVYGAVMSQVTGRMS